MLPEIKTILYCTQLGPNSAYVFRYAYSIAKRFDARIVVLHVVETLNPRQRAMVEGYAGEGSLAGVLRKAEQEAARRIPRRIEEFCHREVGHEDWRKVVSEIVVAEGHASEQILDHVDKTGADLLVVGAHTESSLLDRLLGSTTRVLVKSSPVPVLTVQVPEGRQDLSATSD